MQPTCNLLFCTLQECVCEFNIYEPHFFFHYLAEVPKIYNRYGAVVSPRTIKKLVAKTPTMTLQDIMKHRPVGSINIGNA